MVEVKGTLQEGAVLIDNAEGLEGAHMADGGLWVRFDAEPQKPQRCYAVAVDYDDWSYVINDQAKTALPQGTQKITIEIERS